MMHWLVSPALLRLRQEDCQERVPGLPELYSENLSPMWGIKGRNLCHIIKIGQTQNLFKNQGMLLNQAVREVETGESLGGQPVICHRCQDKQGYIERPVSK